MNQLPNDLFVLILTFVDPWDIVSCQAVSRDWRITILSNDRELWKRHVSHSKTYGKQKQWREVYQHQYLWSRFAAYVRPTAVSSSDFIANEFEVQKLDVHEFMQHHMDGLVASRLNSLEPIVCHYLGYRFWYTSDDCFYFIDEGRKQRVYLTPGSRIQSQFCKDFMVVNELKRKPLGSYATVLKNNDSIVGSMQVRYSKWISKAFHDGKCYKQYYAIKALENALLPDLFKVALYEITHNDLILKWESIIADALIQVDVSDLCVLYRSKNKLFILELETGRLLNSILLTNIRCANLVGMHILCQLTSGSVILLNYLNGTSIYEFESANPWIVMPSFKEHLMLLKQDHQALVLNLKSFKISRIPLNFEHRQGLVFYQSGRLYTL